MSIETIQRGISHRDALNIAKSIGCRIDFPNKTGEVRVTAPNGRRVRMNNRRKDASLQLLTVLRQYLSKQDVYALF